MKHTLSLKEGSYAFGLWRKPPVAIYLRVYVFNVSNSEAFLRGEERLRLEEVGPYVYREELENVNPDFGSTSDDSLTFEPRRTVHWEPELSRGSLQDKIVVPNIPLVALASLAHKSSRWTNLALSTLINYLESQPFLNLTVEEYFWGHEEPLLSFASTVLPTWITFSSLGLLDRLYAMDSHNITINDGSVHPDNRYKIKKVNGAGNLGKWAWANDPKPDEVELYEACKTRDSVVGTYDGILYPQNLGRDSLISVYRDAFCRPMVLEYLKDVTIGRDLPALRFQPLPGFLNSSHPENSCLCKKDKDKCLPDGLSDMSPCYFGIPIAVSFPHMYRTHPKLREDILGMFPDKEKHTSYVDIQPIAGIPLQTHSRIQLNLIVRDTSRVQKAAPFKNLVIPIIWTDLGVDELPPSLLSLVHLLVVVAPILQQVAIYGLSSIGTVMMIASFYVHFCLWLKERSQVDAHHPSTKWTQMVSVASCGTLSKYIPVEGIHFTAGTLKNNKLQEKIESYISDDYSRLSDDNTPGPPLLTETECLAKVVV
ncbi:scavenger receptor class B member 1-like isoform X2 [Ischnura elegans]|nr:scavenger receptor class B member 1-like isoform X2 [Ischnura elegans]XP_046403667.1 scavenger receptor class B member 1-like isoform X2 [Ischnura elegans]XP_046403668.1 scavenger receptor class B member 1-like isoform X2 [Ischnura elegans]